MGAEENRYFEIIKLYDEPEPEQFALANSGKKAWIESLSNQW